jgi:hypothetical protein
MSSHLIRRQPLHVCTLAVIVGVVVAACGDGRTSHANVLPSARLPSLALVPVSPIELSQAIASYLSTPPGDIIVENTLGAKDVAAAAFSVHGHPNQRGVASFVRQAGHWTVDEASTGLWQHVPLPGSRRYPLTTIGAGRWIVVGGFVDPRVTRVIVESPTGHPLDSSAPHRGAVAVIAADWLPVVAYQGSTLLFATPVTLGRVPAGESHPDSTGRRVGDLFVADILASKLPLAAKLLFHSLAAPSFLPPIAHLVESMRLVRASTTDAGASYVLYGPSGRATLEITLIQEHGRWTIWSYTLSSVASR